MSFVFGLYQANSGSIKINGQDINLKSPRDSIINGIGMVHQHFMLVENFTVLENIILGFEGETVFGEKLEKAKKDLKKLCETYNFNLDLDATISDLSIGFRQRVEILKSLYRGAEILILDEPTGVLTPQEVDELFKILRSLKDEGKTIVLITHKLIEIMDLTSEVSVMRQGEIVGHTKTLDTNKEKLAEMMVGRSVLLRVNKQEIKKGEVIFKVKNLSVKDDLDVTRVKDVNLEICSGEILGIAGVTGNGQTELLEALSGIRKSRVRKYRVIWRKISDQDNFFNPKNAQREKV
jgi:ABC-type uncharacterized transport systems, ATPase components